MLAVVPVTVLSDACTVLTEDQELSGEPVLPGFRMPVARFFARMKDKTPRSGRRKKKS